MTRRSKDWNEGLAQDLKDTEFAKQFLIATLEEEISIQVALGKIARAYGVKEFAKKKTVATILSVFFLIILFSELTLWIFLTQKI